MPKIITVVGTTNWNPGDTLTDIGVQYLIRQLFPGSYLQYVRAPIINFDDILPADVLIVAGTPWLWDRCVESSKARVLAKVVANSHASLKIAMGVGSSFLLRHELTKKDVEAMKQMFGGFDLVMCRDELIHAACIDGGITSCLVQCPSTFAAAALDIHSSKRFKHDHCHFYLSTHRCFIHKYITEEQHMAVAAAQRECLKTANQVVVVNKDDREEYAEKFGALKIHCRFSKDPRYLLSVMSMYQKVTSVRVHGVLPALSLQCNASIIPIDSRALSAINFGVKLYTGFENILNGEVILPLMPVGDILKQIRTRVMIKW